jgi:hypothetical protein
MTAPAPIIRLPGIGEELQAGLAPFIAALQQRQQLATSRGFLANQQQQLALSQRQQAIGMLTQGIQTGGEEFLKSDSAKELATQAGAADLPKDLADALRRSKRERFTAFETSLEGFQLDEQSKLALRAGFTLQAAGFPAATVSDMVQRMSPDAPLSPLDEARLNEIRLKMARLKPKNQQAAFSVLGFPEEEFVPGVDYIGMLEDITTAARKEFDPSKLVLNGAFRLLADFKDILGRRTVTPAEALDMSQQMVGSLFPGAAALEFPPEMGAQLEAMANAIDFINLSREKDGEVTVGGRTEKFKNDKELEDFIRTQLRLIYGPPIEPVLNDILRLAFGRAREE